MMNWKPIQGLVLGMLLGGLTLTAQAEGPTGQNWLRDLQSAHKASNAANKPMVLVFGAKECVYCRKLEKQTLDEASVSRTLETSFVPVYLDYHQNLKAAEILEIKALPCTVILSPQADLLVRFNGFVDAKQFQVNLQTALKAQAQIVPSSAP